MRAYRTAIGLFVYVYIVFNFLKIAKSISKAFQIDKKIHKNLYTFHSSGSDCPELILLYPISLTQSLDFRLRRMHPHYLYLKYQVPKMRRNLWILNEIIQKKYPENLKEIVGAVWKLLAK